jgi:hypothetical protein
MKIQQPPSRVPADIRASSHRVLCKFAYTSQYKYSSVTFFATTRPHATTVASPSTMAASVARTLQKPYIFHLLNYSFRTTTAPGNCNSHASKLQDAHAHQGGIYHLQLHFPATKKDIQIKKIIKYL